MKIGFLGGTFNPPHNGHLALARAWRERLRLEKFLITPTGTPPHKQPTDIPGEVRLEMCRIAATESDIPLEPYDFEVRRSGQKSYSVITLAELHREYPHSEIYMVMGADMFMSLESWYDFNRLKTLAVFCTMPRDGISFEKLQEHRRRLKSVGCEGLVADLPEITLSSTEIRRRVSDGEPIHGLVPDGVEKYIYSHGLYSNQNQRKG